MGLERKTTAEKVISWDLGGQKGGQAAVGM